MSILDKIKSEPAAITGVVTALGMAAVDYGLITTTQEGHLLGLVSSVLALLGAGVVRQNVSPTSKPTVPSGIHPAAVDVSPAVQPANDGTDA